MADKEWGQGAVNNDVNWGKARFNSSLIEPNAYGWGAIYEKTWTGDTNIVGVGKELQQDNDDYYVYVLEQKGGDYLRGRIYGEFWLDDTTKIFNYWNNATSFTPAVGSKSFYGTADTGWITISGGLYDWWGCGMYVNTPSIFYNLTSSNFKLHIGLRVQNRQQFQTEIFSIGVGGAQGTEGVVTVGSTQGGSQGDFNFEWGTSEWQYIEIPRSLLTSRGMTAVGSMSNQNYLTFFSDGASKAVDLEVDAVFWYRES